ncbi:MAG TPA: Uma2 family endonuclease [Longimicrobium sp.]|nr:Uma2 family endonuclease [Longimicrobium sp.]
MSVPESKIHRFTTGEFQQIGEEELMVENARVELLNGELVEMTPIGSRHMSGVIRVERLFNRLLGETVVVSAQNPVELGGSWPQPDVAVLIFREELYADRVPDAADCLLLVEVSDSTSLLDRNVKRRLYARAGILEYWVVDLRSRSVVVHRLPSGDDYDDVNEYAADGSWMSPALGGREIRARDVLGPAESLDTR